MGWRRLPATLRPHVKGHKSPDLALLQAQAGVRGFSTATVWEAVILAEAGLDDLFVVNTVEGPAKIGRLIDLARERRVLVAVDNPANAIRLSREATERGATLGVLIEIDTGMRRAGLAEPAQAAELARRLVDLPGLRFEGVTGYEGHCSLEDDVDDGSSSSARRWRSCSRLSPRSRRPEWPVPSSPPAAPEHGG